MVHNKEVIVRLFIDVFLDSFSVPPEEIVLDFDHTDDQIHGDQAGSFFHGYHDHHVYLPLYVFCDQHLLVATPPSPGRRRGLGAKLRVKSTISLGSRRIVGSSVKFNSNSLP